MIKGNKCMKNQDHICCLCHDTFFRPTTLECGHTLCQGCLMEYFASMDTQEYQCPLCRKSLRYQNSEPPINTVIWNAIQSELTSDELKLLETNYNNTMQRIVETKLNLFSSILKQAQDNYFLYQNNNNFQNIMLQQLQVCNLHLTNDIISRQYFNSNYNLLINLFTCKDIASCTNVITLAMDNEPLWTMEESKLVIDKFIEYVQWLQCWLCFYSAHYNTHVTMLITDQEIVNLETFLISLLEIQSENENQTDLNKRFNDFQQFKCKFQTRVIIAFQKDLLNSRVHTSFLQFSNDKVQKLKGASITRKHILPLSIAKNQEDATTPINLLYHWLQYIFNVCYNSTTISGQSQVLPWYWCWTLFLFTCLVNFTSESSKFTSFNIASFMTNVVYTPHIFTIYYYPALVALQFMPNIPIYAIVLFPNSITLLIISMANDLPYLFSYEAILIYPLLFHLIKHSCKELQQINWFVSVSTIVILASLTNLENIYPFYSTPNSDITLYILYLTLNTVWQRDNYLFYTRDVILHEAPIQFLVYTAQTICPILLTMYCYLCLTPFYISWILFNINIIKLILITVVTVLYWCYAWIHYTLSCNKTKLDTMEFLLVWSIFYGNEATFIQIVSLIADAVGIYLPQ